MAEGNRASLRRVIGAPASLVACPLLGIHPEHDRFGFAFVFEQAKNETHVAGPSPR